MKIFKNKFNNIGNFKEEFFYISMKLTSIPALKKVGKALRSIIRRLGQPNSHQNINGYLDGRVQCSQPCGELHQARTAVRWWNAATTTRAAAT